MGRYEKVDGIPTIEMPMVGDATLVRGAAGCGKTQWLLDRIATLLAQGVEADQLLVLCATPDAALAFSRRLGIAGVTVCGAQEFALQLLAHPDACRLFGQEPRVLLPYEEDILFEDLKVSGLELDRLSGMLGFFKRSMTEIADDHPDFLMDDDERKIMELIRRALSLRGAYLEQQLSANASRYLNTVGKDVRYAHVFVDDAQLLSRASQVMAGLLAEESLCVTCDATATDRVLESYPYAKGVDEFLAANPQAATIDLTAFCGARAVGRAMNAVRGEAGLPDCEFSHSENVGDSPSPQAEDPVLVDVVQTPESEIMHAADVIVDALAKDMLPEDVFVVAPHPHWERMICDALSERGIQNARSCDMKELATSESDRGDAGYLRVLTALLLAGDACDDTAWRSWCAFDDPLAASGEIDVIAGFAQDQGLRLHEALAELANGSARLIVPSSKSGLNHVMDAYRRGVRLLERAQDLSRDDLLRMLTDEICSEESPLPDQLLALCSGTSSRDGAASLRKQILERVASPSWLIDAKTKNIAEPTDAFSAYAVSHDASAGAVRIGPAQRLCGQTPRFIVFTGFVNGLFPKHGFFDLTVTPPGDIDKAHAANARRLCTAIGKASDRVAFTAFTKIPCEQAERYSIKIDRIALEKRVRMARVSPSIFTDVIQKKR